MLEQAETLLDKGIHPSRIADGFERACQIAVKHLESVSDTVPFTPQETSNLFKVAKTCLGSKMYVLLFSLRARELKDAIASQNAMINTRKLRWTPYSRWPIWNAKTLISN